MDRLLRHSQRKRGSSSYAGPTVAAPRLDSTAHNNAFTEVLCVVKLSVKLCRASKSRRVVEVQCCHRMYEMRLALRYHVLCVVALAIAFQQAGTARASDPHDVCSIVWAAGVRAPLHFLGTATGDTVLAGRGAVEPTGQFGHSGSGASRPVYGQLVRIDRLGEDAPEALRAAILGQSDGLVAIVPWDYDPSCRPTYWARSSLWLEPQLQGVHTALLRRPEHWADGRPTLDVIYTIHTPYPSAAVFRYERPGIPVSTRLTPVEYFELYSALPNDAELRARSSDARLRLAAWETANPALVDVYPANMILRIVKPRLAPSSEVPQ
jgi:hypothetical protein